MPPPVPPPLHDPSPQPDSADTKKPAWESREEGDSGELISLTGTITARRDGTCQAPLSGRVDGADKSVAPDASDVSDVSARPRRSLLQRRKGFRPNRKGEPYPRIPKFFKALFRKPSRRQHALALHLEKYAFGIFGPERAIPVLCSLAAQRLLSLDSALFSPELLADKRAMDAILALSVAVAMEKE